MRGNHWIYNFSSCYSPSERKLWQASPSVIVVCIFSCLYPCTTTGIKSWVMILYLPCKAVDFKPFKYAVLVDWRCFFTGRNKGGTFPLFEYYIPNQSVWTPIQEIISFFLTYKTMLKYLCQLEVLYCTFWNFYYGVMYRPNLNINSFMVVRWLAASF